MKYSFEAKCKNIKDPRKVITRKVKVIADSKKEAVKELKSKVKEFGLILIDYSKPKEEKETVKESIEILGLRNLIKEVLVKETRFQADEEEGYDAVNQRLESVLKRLYREYAEDITEHGAGYRQAIKDVAEAMLDLVF
jgi:hypothetical protein